MALGRGGRRDYAICADRAASASAISEMPCERSSTATKRPTIVSSGILEVTVSAGNTPLGLPIQGTTVNVGAALSLQPNATFALNVIV